jgi:hypothetical protein
MRSQSLLWWRGKGFVEYMKRKQFSDEARIKRLQRQEKKKAENNVDASDRMSLGG